MGDPLLDWLADVSRLPAVETVALSALPPEDPSLSWPPWPDRLRRTRLVDDVLRRGEGSPFFIEQLRGRRPRGGTGGASDEVPAGIGRLLGNRVRSVSGPASEVAAALAVAGRPFGTGAGSLRRRASMWRRLRASSRCPAGRAAEDVGTGCGTRCWRTPCAACCSPRSEPVCMPLRAECWPPGHRVARGGGRALARAGDQPRGGSLVGRGRPAGRVDVRLVGPAASWLRVWDLETCSSRRRPEVEPTAVVLGSCWPPAASTPGRAHGSCWSGRRRSLDHLGRRVTAWSTWLYGNWLELTDVAAGVATMQRAGALFERSGPPARRRPRAADPGPRQDGQRRRRPLPRRPSRPRRRGSPTAPGTPRSSWTWAADRGMDLSLWATCRPVSLVSPRHRS